MIIREDDYYIILCKCDTATEVDSLQVFNGVLTGWCPFCGASHQILLSQVSPSLVFGRN